MNRICRTCDSSFELLPDKPGFADICPSCSSPSHPTISIDQPILQYRGKPQVSVYTDGACVRNPGPGGWGAILIYHAPDGKRIEREIYGFEEKTTNNRMEMLAAIRALEELKRPCEVTIYSDSQYLVQGASQWLKKWRMHEWETNEGSAVKNQDLWKRIVIACERHKVSWVWVKGHHLNTYNNRCDRIAVQAAKMQTTNL